MPAIPAGRKEEIDMNKKTLESAGLAPHTVTPSRAQEQMQRLLVAHADRKIELPTDWRNRLDELDASLARTTDAGEGTE